MMVYFSRPVRKMFELCSGTRVTRLGEFSPIVQLFTLGIFLKIEEVAQIYGLIFFTVKIIYKI
jgi:hypothetical protein